jgi:hypothetical protein
MLFILVVVWHGLYTAFDIDNRKKREYENMMNAKAEHNTSVISYDDFKWKNMKISKCFDHYYTFKSIIIILLFFIYPCQITFSYFRGSRDVDGSLLNNILIGILSVIIVFMGVYIYYTLRLKITLSRSYETPVRTNKIFNRMATRKLYFYLIF